MAYVTYCNLRLDQTLKQFIRQQILIVGLGELNINILNSELSAKFRRRFHLEVQVKKLMSIIQQ